MVSGIERYLTAPSAVAQAVLWHQSRPALFIHLGARAIDLATLTHPAAASATTVDEDDPIENPIQLLPSIPLEEETHDGAKYMKPRVLEQLSQIVNLHNVSGIIVSWPVERSGWMGAPCGKVMHALDQMANDMSIVMAKPHQSRPICLWDGHHFAEHHPELQDKFERLPLYASTTATPSTTIYRAGQERYRDDGMQAAAVAADYLRVHWPDLVALLVPEPFLQDEDKEKKLDMQESNDVAEHSDGEIEEGEESLWTENQTENKRQPHEKSEPRSPTVLRDQGEIQRFEESLWISEDELRHDVDEEEFWTNGEEFYESPEIEASEEKTTAPHLEKTSEMLQKRGDIMAIEAAKSQPQEHAQMRGRLEPGYIETSEENLWIMNKDQGEIMSTEAAKSQPQHAQTREPLEPGYIETSEENLWMMDKVLVPPQIAQTREPKEPGYIEESEDMMWLTNTESQEVQTKESQQPGYSEKSEEFVWTQSQPRQYEQSTTIPQQESWATHDVFLTKKSSDWVAQMLVDPKVVGVDMAMTAASKQKRKPSWMNFYYNPTTTPVTIQHRQQHPWLAEDMPHND